MGDLDDHNDVVSISDLVEDPVAALSHSVELSAGQLLGIGPSGLVSQCRNPFQNPRNVFLGYAA